MRLASLAVIAFLLPATALAQQRREAAITLGPTSVDAEVGAIQSALERAIVSANSSNVTSELLNNDKTPELSAAFKTWNAKENAEVFDAVARAFQDGDLAKMDE